MSKARKTAKKRGTTPGYTSTELQYFKDGKTDKEISELTGRTRTAIYAKRGALKESGFFNSSVQSQQPIKALSTSREGMENLVTINIEGVAMTIDTKRYSHVTVNKDNSVTVR